MIKNINQFLCIPNQPSDVFLYRVSDDKCRRSDFENWTLNPKS
jgi:hypothetical protein